VLEAPPVAAASPVAVAPPVATAPPAEPVAAAKITPAEVLAAGEAFSAHEDDEEQDDEEEEEAPPAKIAAPVVAKKAEEPKKVEAPAPAKKAEEPKKAEPIAAAKKVEAPVSVKKAEEPKKSEPQPPPGNKKIDTAKAGNSKKGGKNEGPKSEARRPVDDDVDTSSISAEFFRREVDSLPPLVDAHEKHEGHEEHDEAGGVHVLSPATIARQARLRRVVAGVVAFASVITLAVVGKTLAAPKQPAISVPMRPTVTQEAKVDPKPEVTATAAPVPAPAKTEEAKAVPAPTASAEVAKVEPDPKADPKAVEDPKKVEEPKKAEPSGGDAKALTKEAEAFLNRGNRKDAMAKAREAIAADPSQAMPYLLLGSALQDSGKWKDGVEAYSECVRNATKGPVNDCRQMGGHK